MSTLIVAVLIGAFILGLIFKTEEAFKFIGTMLLGRLS